MVYHEYEILKPVRLKLRERFLMGKTLFAWSASNSTDDMTDEFLKELIELPRVWTTLDNGIEIKELKYDGIDEVIKIIKEHYIFEDPSMTASQMHADDESVEHYLNLSRHWMMDTLSTVAVEIETGNTIGFLICRFNEIAQKDPEFSSARICEGKIWKQLLTFKHYMNKRSNVYKHFNVDKVLEIYSLYVLPSYRGQGIAKELLNNVIQRQLPEYEWFKVYVITGVFTDKVSQHIAESLGMETLYSFIYAGWIVNNEETGEPEKFFKEAVSDNYSAKLMALQITDATSELSSANVKSA